MFYRLAIFVLTVLSHIIFRIKVEGKENIPQEGGFILCSNHVTGYDPVFLAVTVKKPLYFMAKKELFKYRISNVFFKALHAFPVDRGSADMTSFKTTTKLLSEGKALLIFAQGHRMKEVEVKGAKSGAALFAIKSGVPVVPVGISASYKIFTRARIKYGTPIDLSKYKSARLKSDTLDEATEIIMSQVKDLTM